MITDKNSIEFIFGSTIRALHKLASIEFEKQNIPVSPEQFHLLKIIASKEDAIQTELAEIMQLDKSGIMRHIDQLETKGFLNRVNDLNDRRKKYVVLTEIGADVLAEIKIIMDEIGKKTLRNISDAEIIIFKQVLNKLKENAEN